MEIVEIVYLSIKATFTIVWAILLASNVKGFANQPIDGGDIE